MGGAHSTDGRDEECI